ncbi:hypothetical protein GCK32_009342 [Trichostrongylus colubriformis]|uniref:Uncharacterized protein n=1 Tax=Trichostrongylus colubriformis TaxID=6319 RepID=A0AAN8ESY9_TRICO
MMIRFIIATALFLLGSCTTGTAEETCCGADEADGRNFTAQLKLKVGGFLSEGLVDGGSYLNNRSVTVCTLSVLRGAQKSLAVRVANDYIHDYVLVGIYKTGVWSISDIDQHEYVSYTGRCGKCCCDLCAR